MPSEKVLRGHSITDPLPYVIMDFLMFFNIRFLKLNQHGFFHIHKGQFDDTITPKLFLHFK